MGYRIGRHLVFSPNGGFEYILRPDAARAVVEELPVAARPHVVEGFEAVCREMTLKR